MEVLNGIHYFPETKTILMAGIDNVDYYDERDLTPISVGNNGYSVMPWGQNNDLPQNILKKIEKSEILSANLGFNISVAYGLGPKLVKIIKDDKGKVVEYLDVEDGPEYEFFESNDIPMFMLSAITDMVYFHNAFAQLIPDKNFKKIHSIRHMEAAFSRWGKMDNKGAINWHYYSSKWDEGVGDNFIRTYCLDEFNTYQDIRKQLACKTKRMVFPSYMPSPGRPYYSIPGWHSIFRSGWFDHMTAIPELKKAIMKNQLGVKFIIYISESYWEQLMISEGVDRNDPKAVKELKEREMNGFSEFLTGEDNASKAIMAIKEKIPMGNSVLESKQIEIIPVENKFSGGEYISDMETASAMMSYAMNVHPSLIGVTLSKSAGSMSGTDKRELYLIKQALMKPLQDRTLRPLRAIPKINGWANDVTIIVPEYIFTTQDQNKSGKQESTTKQL